MTSLFAHPRSLWICFLALLLLLPLSLRARRRKEKILSILGEPKLLQQFFSPGFFPLRKIRFFLELGGIFFLGLALAGPQWGIRMSRVFHPTRPVFIALDVSLSMAAEDASPSRLQKAKSLLSHLIDRLPGSRVGIIAFAGVAQIQCPLTIDLEAAKMFLQTAEINLLPQAGTAIGEAIRLATQNLKKRSGTKALILLTDGEDHQSDPLDAARLAQEAGIRIHAIGIGNPRGEPIPIRDPSGNLLGYKRNKKGEVVVSRLNETALQEIAQITQGRYFRASPGEGEAEEIAQEIEKISQDTQASRLVQQLENRFQIPLLLSILFLLSEIFLPEKKIKKWNSLGS